MNNVFDISNNDPSNIVIPAAEYHARTVLRDYVSNALMGVKSGNVSVAGQYLFNSKDLIHQI